MNADIVDLDHERAVRRPQVELTRSQEARVRFGLDMVEALSDQLAGDAETCRKIDRQERAIEKHLVEMGFGDIVA